MNKELDPNSQHLRNSFPALNSNAETFGERRLGRSCVARASFPAAVMLMRLEMLLSGGSFQIAPVSGVLAQADRPNGTKVLRFHPTTLLRKQGEHRPVQWRQQS